MAYLVPSEFVTKMVDAGESKIFMSTRDTIIRAYMAGAMLDIGGLVRRHDERQHRPADSSERCCSRSASACSICSASTC